MGTEPFRAAIFDMDGLLIDSERVIRDVWLEVASRGGIRLTEADYLQVVGRDEADARAILSDLFTGDLTFEEAGRRVAGLLDSSDGGHRYPVKPGAAELLLHLRTRAIPCCVASSTHRAEVERRLEQCGLLHFFESISGGDEVVRGKPSPDLFALAGQRLRVTPQHCLVFEDSEHGIVAAVAAGMSAVMVPDLKAPNDDIRSICVAVLRSLEQALPLCDAWFAAGASRNDPGPIPAPSLPPDDGTPPSRTLPRTRARPEVDSA